MNEKQHMNETKTHERKQRMSKKNRRTEKR